MTSLISVHERCACGAQIEASAHTLSGIAAIMAPFRQRHRDCGHVLDAAPLSGMMFWASMGLPVPSSVPTKVAAHPCRVCGIAHVGRCADGRG